MSRAPRLLVVAGDPALLERWRTAAGELAEVRTADGFEAARAICLEAEPDICAVDLSLRTSHQELALVALRGLAAGAELIGIGTSPSVSGMTAMVNDAQVRRFVPVDASDSQIVAVLDYLWGSQHSTRMLREQVRRLAAERERLVQERDALSSELSRANVRLAATAQEEAVERGRLERLLGTEMLPTNVRTLPELKQRLGEEVERFRRYRHPLSVLRVGVMPHLSQEIVSTIGGAVRIIDLVAPRGDDELWVLMPVTLRGQAQVALERIVAAVESVGGGAALREPRIVAYPEDGPEIEELVS